MRSAPPLSIVIPAYNEAKRISRTLETLQEYLESKGWVAEVIVVNDGSSDDTVAVVRSYISRWNALRLVDNGGNRGKASAFETARWGRRATSSCSQMPTCRLRLPRRPS